jgi:hypothetical protein
MPMTYLQGNIESRSRSHIERRSRSHQGHISQGHIESRSLGQISHSHPTTTQGPDAGLGLLPLSGLQQPLGR